MGKRPGRKRKIAKISLPPIAMMEVDNPMFSPDHAETKSNPKRIMAAYNAKESYVGLLFIRGHISAAERRAGDKVRQAFEMMGGAGARAIDYSRTKVDGGQIASTVTIEQLQAGATLRECHSILGAQGHDLIIRIAGEGKTPRDIAPSNERMQNYLSMRLRECLETLAVHWGYQNRPFVAARMG
jgi:hypothetical protein